MDFRVASLIGRRPAGRAAPSNGPKKGSFWPFKGSSAGTLLRTAAPVQFNPPPVAAAAVVAATVCDNDGIENIDNEIRPTAVASPTASDRLYRIFGVSLFSLQRKSYIVRTRLLRAITLAAICSIGQIFCARLIDCALAVIDHRAPPGRRAHMELEMGGMPQ